MSIFSRRKIQTQKKTRSSYQTYLAGLQSNPALHRAYENLVDNLQLITIVRPFKTMCITSTQPEEGKTTVALSIAVTMTQAGRKVILVDGDMRKPKLHIIFQIPKSPGFSEVLTGTADIDQVLQRVEVPSQTPGGKSVLTVIASGQGASNFSIPKVTTHCTDAMNYLGQTFDFVILDSPPVLAVSDALFLSKCTEAVLFVVKPGAVDKTDAARSKERLEQVNAQLIGTVMNLFDQKQHGSGYHPYASYYSSEDQS
jgi:capsular exopolysaccharide synthesis family protein